MPLKRTIKKEREHRGLILSIAAFLLVAAVAVVGVQWLNGRMDVEQTTLLEDALRKAAVTCYAVEGRYPVSLEYLVENYGVVVDTEKFIVRYDVIAPNLMPIIRVIYLKGVVG